jgi:hypothetical protein
MMVKRWLLKTVLACVGIFILAIGAIFLVQHLSEEPERRELRHEGPLTGGHRGRVLLSLSSAFVTVEAGRWEDPLRVEARFDPDVYYMEQLYEEGNDGEWTYRLDFHEKSLLHISVISIWLGKRSPEVTISIPPDLPLDLEAKMEGGYLVVDLAGLAVAEADIELNRGILAMFVSDPMEVPMERLSASARMGTMFLDSLGNASPGRLDVRQGLGAARVGLRGRWQRDADVDFQVAFGTGEMELPGNVLIEGIERQLEAPRQWEIPPPTLRIHTHYDVGDIRVTD